MKSRGLVVAIAVVLAVLAAVGVIVYTNGVREEVLVNETRVVIVATQDIPANTALDPLIDGAVFNTINVPLDNAVDGAVTSIEDLRGRITTAPIFANEQIPLSRVGEGDAGLLGISPGHVGLGVQVEGARAVNGSVQRGTNVVIYATFKKGVPVTRDSLETLMSNAEIEEFFKLATGGSTTPVANRDVVFMPYDFTLELVRSVKVLAVQNPPIDETTGRQGEGASTFILDLLPDEARDLVFGSEQALGLWVGLLPAENEDGYGTEAQYGVPIGKLVGVGTP
jgi:hypothetical protein